MVSDVAVSEKEERDRQTQTQTQRQKGGISCGADRSPSSSDPV